MEADVGMFPTRVTEGDAAPLTSPADPPLK